MNSARFCLGLALGVGASLVVACSAASEPVVLDSAALWFAWSPTTGEYQVRDRRTQVVWRSNPGEPRFGQATVEAGGQRRTVSLTACSIHRIGGGLEARFHPLTEQPSAWVAVRVRLLDGGDGLEFGLAGAGSLAVHTLRLLDQALWVTDAEQGYLVVPVREGLLIPADSGQAFQHAFDTYAYEGCHLAMLGLVKQGSAALVSWDDPYVLPEVESRMPPPPGIAGRQVLLPSLSVRRTARTVRLRLLGAGDHVGIGKAYRTEAKRKGWLTTWPEKLKGHPERARLFGAVNFKLWSALDREMTEDSATQKQARVNWTFGEAAQVAEHLKRDLKLDRVFFLMGGWIRRGYDNQHPDILPAAPECGGDAALADCTQRVRRLGYLFGLHDNYQDMYRDSPSWDERWLMRTADGSLAKGGVWAGGRAYLTCARMAVELAQRPQNLPAVRRLTGAEAYFIDTTYAAGLQECFSPAHPLTRADDLKWKQVLSDQARRLFPVFGSECGREWAIPHSDFFEGLTGVSGQYYHDTGLLKKVGGVAVPLFEAVYRDCIALYGKYGYDPAKAGEYVLHHLLIGRPLHYHNVPAHLYWQQPRRPESPAAGGEGAFVQAHNGWAAGLHPLDRFLKNTYEILSPLYELTAQTLLTEHRFLTPDRKAQRSVFGLGARAVVVVANAGAGEISCASRLGGAVTLPPFGFLVEAPGFVAFHALSWSGRRYEKPVLFTLRSTDGKPLAASKQVRVFHGFGDARLLWRGQEETVEREALLPPGGH